MAWEVRVSAAPDFHLHSFVEIQVISTSTGRTNFSFTSRSIPKSPSPPYQPNKPSAADGKFFAQLSFKKARFPCTKNPHSPYLIASTSFNHRQNSRLPFTEIPVTAEDHAIENDRVNLGVCHRIGVGTGTERFGGHPCRLAVVVVH